MLNAFKNTTLNAFKTAFIYNPVTEAKQPFKYRLMTDKEIKELQFMKGLDTDTTTMTIATNDTVYIDTKSRLIINGFFYSVIAVTEKLSDNINGMFRNTTERTLYMVVETGAVYDKRIFSKTN